MAFIEWLGGLLPTVTRLVAKCLGRTSSFSEPPLLDTSGLSGEALEPFRGWRTGRQTGSNTVFKKNKDNSKSSVEVGRSVIQPKIIKVSKVPSPNHLRRHRRGTSKKPPSNAPPD
ncbi:hypothetical protein PGQ11_011051 [Apiospora arundinis]|uniref:Uncharacterized protein n=1 Tax=Apiospora arundinis TaxID=335852 RepID=A0ABR2HYD3_9PEZI